MFWNISHGVGINISRPKIEINVKYYLYTLEAKRHTTKWMPRSEQVWRTSFCNVLQHVWHIQGLMFSHPELTQDHVLPARILDFLNRRDKYRKYSVWRKKTVLGFPSTNMQWISLFKSTKVSLLFSFRSGKVSSCPKDIPM